MSGSKPFSENKSDFKSSMASTGMSSTKKKKEKE
jgi:hypothetical protein